MVGIVGMLAISLVAIAVLWTTNDAASPEDTLARLPNNMHAVAAVSIEQLWKHEALKSIWENPITAQYLMQAESFSGVNNRALETVLAGGRITDNGLEWLYLVTGSFEPEQLNTLISTVCPTDIVISGHRLSHCNLSNMATPPALDQLEPQTADDAKNHESKASIVNTSEPHSAPPFASIAIGAWDESHFVAGTPSLIEAYFAGGDQVGNNSKMESLLAEVDPTAFGWGAVDVESLYSYLKTQMPGLEGIPALKESSLVFELLLRGALELRVECIVANAQTANSIKALATLPLQAAISAANENLAMTGRSDLLSGTLETSENRLKLHMRFVIPSIPF
jgi:hypothetical protein